MATVRRLNKRLVAILTIVTMLVVTAGIAVMFHYTTKKDPELYGQRGDRLMESKQYRRAAGSYARAYRYSNKDPKWLVKAAKALYQAAEIGPALGHLQNAVIADPTFIEAQKEIVEIFYELYGQSRTAAPAAMKQMEEAANKLIEMLPSNAKSDPQMKKVLAFAHHCRGLSFYARRAEDATLAEKAEKEIKEALEIDAQTDYVRSLAMIRWDEARQLARLAAVDNISTEQYDEYARQMREKLAEAKDLYRNAIKRAPGDPQLLLAFGSFCNNFWSGSESNLASFCQFQGQMRNGKIRSIEEGIAALEGNEKINADEKRRRRQSLRRQITRLKREIPEWEKRAQDHAAQREQARNEALSIFQEALKNSQEKSDRIDALLALATYWLQEENYAEAEKLAKEAKQLDPEGYRAYLVLADVYHREARKLSGQEAEAKINQAIKVLEHRLNDVPHQLEFLEGRRNQQQRAVLLITLAELSLRRGKEQDLQAVSTYLTDLEPVLGESPLLYQLKARWSLAGRRPIEAIKFFEKADSLLNERDANVKRILAELYRRQGEIGAAKAAIDKAVMLAPISPEILRLAAMIYLQAGDSEGALRYSERILSLSGREKDLAGLRFKLEALVRLDELERAGKVAETLQELGLKIDWPVQKARLLIARGKPAEAEGLLRQALAEDPEKRTAAIYLIEAYIRQDKLEQAKQLVDEMLKESPEDKGLQRMKELVAIDDPVKRRERLREMARELGEQRLAAAMEAAKEEKDPYLKAVRLFNQYWMRGDQKNARKYLMEAVKIDAKRATPLRFGFALAVKDWELARKCVILAKNENLDGVNGLRYQGRFDNARSWSLANAGREEEAKASFEQSAKVLEQVIAQLPNDSLARALLGEAYLWTARRAEAETQISRALKLNPRNPYALRARAFQQWLSISERIPFVEPEEASQFAQNVQMVFRQLRHDDWLKGKMEWIREQLDKNKAIEEDKEGNAEDVVRMREKRRKEKPDDLWNLLRLAWVYENRSSVKDFDKAEQCYQQALEQKPIAPVLRPYLAFATRHKRLEGLGNYLKELAEKRAKKGSGDGYSILAFYHHATGAQDLAEQSFLKAVEVDGTAAKRLDVAVFYNRMGKVKKTAEWARKTLEVKCDTRQDQSARILLINSLLQTGEWDQAGVEIQKYQQAHAGDPRGKLLEARLTINEGKLSQAEAALTEILSDNPEDTAALDYRTNVYIYQWKLAEARSDLQRLLRITSQRNERLSSQGRIRLAKLYCELGQPTQAAEEARKILESLTSQPDWLEPVRTELMPALCSAMPAKEYEQLLVWAANLHRGYWGWPFERGQLHMARGRYGPASEAFKQAWENVQYGPVGLRLMVLEGYMEALFKGGRYEAMMSLANKALVSIGTNSAPVLAWQAVAMYKTNQEKEALERYFKSMGSVKDQPLVIWQITRQRMLKAVPGERLVAFLEDKLRSEKDLELAITQGLACAYFGANKPDKGIELYKKVLEGISKAESKSLIGYIAARELSDQGKYQKAAEVLAESKKYDPENVVILNNLAYVLAEHLNRGREAVKLIEQAYRVAPNNPDLLDTYGLILQDVGEQEKALVYLAKSVWIKESSASRYHLGTLLGKMGRTADARNQLHRALAIVGEDKELEKRIRDALKQI